MVPVIVMVGMLAGLGLLVVLMGEQVRTQQVKKPVPVRTDDVERALRRK